MPETTFDSKALILGQLWLQHREDDEMSDFFKYNDLGVPLAFAFAEGVINHTPTVEKYINETFMLLLEALDLVDSGFEDLTDIWDLLAEQQA